MSDISAHHLALRTGRPSVRCTCGQAARRQQEFRALLKADKRHSLVDSLVTLPLLGETHFSCVHCLVERTHVTLHERGAVHGARATYAHGLGTWTETFARRLAQCSARGRYHCLLTLSELRGGRARSRPARTRLAPSGQEPSAAHAYVRLADLVQGPAWCSVGAGLLRESDTGCPRAFCITRAAPRAPGLA